MSKYIYPCLSSPLKDLGFVRLSGPGLANCMFVAARAYSYAKKYNAEFIEPTWFKFSIGPYLRREKDKRHYGGLFQTIGVSGIKKYLLIKRHSLPEVDLQKFEVADSGVLRVEGLGRYFEDIVPTDAKEYFDLTIKQKIKDLVNNDDFANRIAVHVRLGDYAYVPDWATPIEWYVKVIKSLATVNPQLEFCVFSDGTDEQLEEILALPNTHRVFYGSAMADIYAISRCQLVVASNSTFSAWGAFMGHKPVLFYSRLFGPLYGDGSQIEHVLGMFENLPNDITNFFLKKD